MQSFHIALFFVCLCFVVNVRSDYPGLKIDTKNQVEEANQIVQNVIKKLEDLKHVDSIDNSKSEEPTVSVQSEKPSSSITQIFGGFVADLFQIPISILKAFSDVISKLAGTGTSGSISISSSSSTSP